jgi:hypothetical protein
MAALPLAPPLCTLGLARTPISAGAPRDTLIYRNFGERIFVAPASLG